MHSNQREQAIRNCSHKWSRQYQPGDTRVRSWQKLGPEHVIHLLETATAGARTDANALLRQLARSPWRIGATVHAGGNGDARGVDAQPHLTVAVAGRSYHLRCKEQPGLHVIGVTA
ncbi:hypothetical protein ACFQZQ_11085 [Lysobacter koreensis]|uniref:Uncharacterized protein n=1 Tax=Lysobacter koreensis TaxID=266122 RepID=A0ABW2YPM0_9GAMM